MGPQEIGNIAWLEPANADRAVAQTIQQELADPHPARDSGGGGYAADRIQVRVKPLQFRVNRWRSERRAGDAVAGAQQPQ